jgi:hypothetical protein
LILYVCIFFIWLAIKYPKTKIKATAATPDTSLHDVVYFIGAVMFDILLKEFLYIIYSY